MDVEKTFISRKPIYESSMALHAYDLVSQPREVGRAPLTYEALETLRSDMEIFSEAGLDQIVGKHRAFVNVSRESVLAGHCLSLSKSRVVLEVLDDLVLDPVLKEELRKLSRMGYRIAVCNTTPAALHSDGQSIADIVSVNVRNLGNDQLSNHVDNLSRLSVRLLADNVDTYDQFELCKKHGFALYRGYFFCTPNDKGTEIPVNRLAALRVLSQLQNPDINLNDLEETIRTDVTLSYKLLRFTNSALVGLNRPVDSIRHAAKMVGIDRIRMWSNLLMFSKVEDKPAELLILATVRAAMCERLASSAEENPRETFFTVGLLSVLDVLMDRPMEAALEELPVSREIKSALTRREGSYGEALQCVVAYERGEWDQVRFKDLKPTTIRSHYLDSLGWVRRISAGLNLYAA